MLSLYTHTCNHGELDFVQPSASLYTPRRLTSLSWRAPLEAFEQLAAFALLLALSPLLLAVAAIIVALSGRSPLLAHRRVGAHGSSLWTLKFRTMWNRDAAPRAPASFIEYIDGTDVPPLKTSRDPRVSSRFAARLRKYSIDELPQLWQVVTGEMSLVGPRPLTEPELTSHYGPAAQEILAVKPGLTGLWQICGRNRLTYRQRRKADLHLVRNFSPRLYLAILLRTPARVLTGRDAC